MKKIHVCLYKNGDEVLNINDVICILRYSFGIEITISGTYFTFSFDEFDKIEVDYYD